MQYLFFKEPYLFMSCDAVDELDAVYRFQNTYKEYPTEINNITIITNDIIKVYEGYPIVSGYSKKPILYRAGELVYTFQIPKHIILK